MSKNLILCASPRKEGNSAFIANTLHACLSYSRVLFLSDYSIAPCTDCAFCKKNPASCIFDNHKNDHAKELFTACFQAENIYIISPIYFYHAPAQLKAFIDRSQKYWQNIEKQVSQTSILDTVTQRNLFAFFVAGRPRGEKLSQGLELTLKYFAPLIEVKLQKTFTLYGLDKADDLKQSHEQQEKLQEYIQLLAQDLK